MVLLRSLNYFYSPLGRTLAGMAGGCPAENAYHTLWIPEVPVMRTLVLFAIFNLAGYELSAQIAPLSWSGEIRVRSEADGRDFKSRTPMNAYTLLRTRVALEARPDENVTAFVQLQDSRVFGEERDPAGVFNTISNTKNLDLHQAYLKLDDFLVNGLSMKLGRIELTFGNERIVGAVGWNNISRAFDGGLIRWSGNKRSMDLFVMNAGETTAPQAVALPGNVTFARDEGQLFSGAYFSTARLEPHRVDVYLFHRWIRKRAVAGHDDLSRFTAGVLSKGSFGSLFYEGEFAYQGGSLSTSDVSASMITGAVGYATGSSILSSFAVGVDYLSGTPADSKVVKTFDPEFYTGHKFHGFMDYFGIIPLTTQDRGLRDAYVRSVSSPTSSSTVSLWVHDFATAESLGGRSSMGQEIDIVGTWRYNKHVAFEMGLSGFLPAEIMKSRFSGSDVSTWGYLSASVTF